MNSSAQTTATHWLQRLADTTITGDLDRHMALISPELQLFGVPGFDKLGYEDWQRQCAHEFPQRLIEAIHYGEPRIRTANDTNILFSVTEKLHTRDGESIRQAVEILLKKKEDGNWLMIQQRILDDKEAEHLGLDR